MDTLGFRLRSLRKEKFLTIAEFSQFIGYSRSSISYWENNLKEPTSGAIIAICDFFDVSADYLLGRTDY